MTVAVLGGAGLGAAFASDWFVSALTPATHAMHMSQDFAGLVVVAIAGNAVENVVGVQLAARNRADFAISLVGRLKRIPRKPSRERPADERKHSCVHARAEQRQWRKQVANGEVDK